MLRSLSSGVSGLQAHQVAMDVVANNIANVNTTGFKYSRANFANLLSQVSQIATAPQGNLGGKNNIGVGLGTSIGSMTTIFSEGSITQTGKNTDVAIQGRGLFIVSADGGKTLQYTRDGNFNFDANGNFVNSGGLVIQGWLRDKNTNKVDSSAPISPIQIPPGLTTPAQATSKIALKANLNSGSDVTNFSAIDGLDKFPKAIDLNNDGILNKSDSLATPQTTYNGAAVYGGTSPYPDQINENSPTHIFQNANGKIIERGQDMGVMTNSIGNGLLLQSGSAVGQGQGEWIGFRNATATASNSVNSGALSIASGDITINNFAIPAISSSSTNTAAQNASAIAAAINALSKKSGVTATVIGTNNDIIELDNNNVGSVKNVDAVISGNGNQSGFSTGTHIDAPMKQFRYTNNTVNQVGWNAAGSIYYFNTSEDLRQGMQHLLRNQAATAAELTNSASNHIGVNGTGAYVTIDSTGKFNIYNPDSTGYSLNIGVSAIVDANTTENTPLTQMLQAMAGSLPAGSVGARNSQAFNVPTHSASIDIYDSLGSKHSVKIDFTKATFNPTTGSSWNVMISVPNPGVINIAGGPTGIPKNIITGKVTFNADGSLSTFTPPSISFTANNGSAPNQTVSLSIGAANSFDGITSFNSTSTTSGISQDGFTGGDLVGIRIDQTGTLVGSFSNGRSFGLAQIAMAKFANDEGLTSTGGNVYTQSANSGDPIIGTAATGGRGAIQSSSLESSNTDLSKALTELIVIQRGYQANAKTITTSNQLLQTLLSIVR